MARYIDMDEIKFTGEVFEDRNNEIYIKLSDVKQSIKQTPTADVVEVKHGSWTFERNGRKVVCSCCETPAPFDKKVGYHTLWTSPYCPNCSAKMDGKDTNVSTK